MSINITENLGGEVKFFETLHGSIRSKELYCVFDYSNYLYANLDGYVDDYAKSFFKLVQFKDE